MFKLKSLLLAGVLLLPGQPTEAQQEPAPSHACATAAEPCDGLLYVPLNWSDPKSEKIPVAFMWLPRGDRSRPALTTVIANGGGPGPLDPSYADLGKALLGPLSERVDVLMVEPRGFGKSAALTCDGLDVTRPATISSCARQVGGKGRFFTTDQAAADVDAVRAALGAQNVTFVGNSYGTLLGQAYATRFPGHLRAMFLNSVVGTGDDGYDRQGFRNQHLMGLASIAAACRRSPACGKIHPRPAVLWDQLVRHLRAEPDPRVPLLRTGSLLTAASIPDARMTPASANAYVKGDPAPLRRLVARAAPPEPEKSPSPALFAYYCGDARFPFDRDAPTSERLRQLAAHDVFWPYKSAEVNGPAIEWTRQCAYWPTPRESPPVAAAYPGIPVLAIGGQFDSDTAPVDAATVAARFPKGRALTVPFGGHGQLFGFDPVSACVQGVLRAFITDPGGTAADPGCSAENYRLLGSFPKRVRDLAVPYGDNLNSEQRRTLAAAFATAADAVAPLNPVSTVPPPRSEPGLRGGRVLYGKDGVVTLERARFVMDAQVNGSVRLDQRTGAVVADLGGRLSLTWQPFRAEDTTEIRGTLDGKRFTVRVPAR